MYGYNYEVHFGIELFDDCKTYQEFSVRLKSRFPTSRPEKIEPIIFDLKSFWEEINYGLQYRGDNSSGLILTNQKQVEVEAEQKVYTDFLREFISDNSQIFTYPDETGIPGYPVFWEYRFIVFNDRNQCLFIYGSSSD